ncbi:hypothetical protein ScPMuIL_014047 [Solemya velum]
MAVSTRTISLCQHICKLGKHNTFLLPKHKILIIPAASKVGLHEHDKKGGYGREIDRPLREKLRQGIKLLPHELRKLKEEAKEKVLCDEAYTSLHGDYEYFWRFGGEQTLADWLVSSDQDHNEGKSKAHLTVSKTNKALFHGYVNQEVPKDGIIKRAGYCNIRSPFNYKSFKRKIPYDWSRYTHLVMRVRGDGRPYMLNIMMDQFFDINWFDQYNYILFTRGGPYWQVAKIPLSKFYLTSKGRIQDKQQAIHLTRVANFGVSIGDGVDGPFSLEIDYIGLVYDQNHTEQFAYEMYQAPAAHVGV